MTSDWTRSCTLHARSLPVTLPQLIQPAALCCQHHLYNLCMAAACCQLLKHLFNDQESIILTPRLSLMGP